MENLGLNNLKSIYSGKRILLTGHTGFKGSWLALWLHTLGAEVHGLALDPDQSPSHWELLQLPIPDHRIDIRNLKALKEVVHEIQPELVFHLAAQPLVRKSYQIPIETWHTNVMGTLHLLEALRDCEATKAAVLVTTDKVYHNQEWPWGYRENDPLGGHDPYSYSKAAMEFAVDCYRKSFFSENNRLLIATARAGNVIGGGDWSQDRLIPDLVRSLEVGDPIQLRYPQATRPWQHVLECLFGYLLLGTKLWEGKTLFAEAWNFGPPAEDNRSVLNVLQTMKTHWPEMSWKMPENQTLLHESGLLYLDHSKARQHLRWGQIWSLDQALQLTAAWYKAFYNDKQLLSTQQLNAFMDEIKAWKHDH